MTGTPNPADSRLTDVLLAALEQTRAATCITTADLDEPGPTIVYVNPAYCEMTGRTRDEVVGCTPRIMQGPLTDRAELDRLRRNLTAGRPFTGETVNYRADGTPFIISWRIDGVRDASGRLTNYIATQEDVTRLRRAERLIEAERRIEGALSAVLSDGPAASATEPQMARLATLACEAVRDLIGAGTVQLLVRTDGTDWYADTAGSGPDRRRWIEALRDGLAAAPGLTSGSDGEARWLAVPVTAVHTDVSGHLVVTDLDADEVAFVDRAGLATVAARTASACSALAEYERQRSVAVALQSDLLPGSDLDAAALDIAVRYRPGTSFTTVGGDWYDAVAVDDRTVLVVGDVAGSGANAAATMGRVRLLGKVLLRDSADVATALRRLDGSCADEGIFATMTAVAIEPTGRFTVASSGHLPPLHRTPQGCTICAVVPGPPLGTGSTRQPPTTPGAVLGEEDLLVLFTDGLVERRDESIDVGLERLAAAVAAGPTDPAGLADAIIDHPDFVGDDDAALLVARLARPDRSMGRSA